MTNTWESLLNHLEPGALADGLALANSTTETIISPTNPDLVLPANFAELGQVYRVTYFGSYSTTGTPTLKLTLRIGGVAGTLLLQTPAITCQSAAAAVTWRLVAELEMRAIGASGSIFPGGQVLGVASAADLKLLPASAPAAVAVDTTTAKSLVLTGQWGTASASNSVTCNYGLIELLTT